MLSYLWTFFNRYSPTFANIRQMSPNPTHVEPVSTRHFAISATHLINTAYSIGVNLLTVHPASKPFYHQQRLDNKVNHATISPSPSLWLCWFWNGISQWPQLDAEFDFRVEFAGIFNYDNFADDLDYESISVSCTRDNKDAPGVTSSRKKRPPNRQYRIHQWRRVAGMLIIWSRGRHVSSCMTLLALIDLENFNIGFECPSIRWRILQKSSLRKGTCHSRALGAGRRNI